MVRRIVLTACLLASTATLGGCFTLTDYSENVRQINHYYESINDIRLLTNKMFFDYDTESPFED